MSTDHAKDMAIGFISGVNGGIATVYVGQPLDTIKVKMQAFPHIYRNAMTCLVDTFKKDGIYRGLYSGTVPALAANIAENSVLFCALEPNKKLVASLIGREGGVDALRPVENALAGSMAAFWSSLVLCPTERVKCRMQALREMVEMGRSTADPKSITPLKITKQILREEGLRGFSKGMVPTLNREIIGYFFFFGGYEQTRKLLTPPGTERKDLSLPRTVFCGGFGGVCLWTIIFPFDVIKSRMQVENAPPSPTGVGVTAHKQMGTVQQLLYILRSEGIGALYKGLGPTLLRTFPATGALFVAYEYTREFFINHFKKDESS